MTKIKIKRELLIEIAFLGFIFMMYTAWAVILPYNECPDEYLRYKIPDYIYRFGTLPRGDDPYILDAAWGISYGFTPILSYIFSGIAMKITGVFTTDGDALLLAARMISVIFSTGTVFFVLKTGKELFKGIYRYLPAVLVAMLPQFMFISAYINCDAISLFSVSWIVFAIVVGNKKKWSAGSCVSLGAAVGVCLLSYYNAYGVILFAAIFAVAAVIMDKDVKNKPKFIATRVGIVFVAAFVVAGWWFIRNAILYDGDLLGLTASSQCAKINAIESLKPENRSTPANAGVSLKYMLIDMQWIKISIDSFIAKFGWMNVDIPQIHYTVIKIATVICLAGNVFAKKIKNVYSVSKESLFNIALTGMIFATVLISMYYSYFNDFQPQGRYCMPLLIPLSIFIVRGLAGITGYMSKKVKNAVIAAGIGVYAYISFDSLLVTLIATYY